MNKSLHGFIFYGICSLVLLMAPMTGNAQPVVWNEDFSGLSNNTTSDAGATAWTTSYSGSGTFSVQGGAFFIYDLNTEGTWTSEDIDISAFGYALIDISGYIYFAGSGDYLRFYYAVDGGPEVLFGNFSDGLFSGAVGSSAIVTGSSLKVIVRALNNSFLDSYQFDNVIVTGVTTLYSRANNNWNTSGTWSVDGLGGASCSCTPNDKTRVVIGSGYTVSIDGAGTTESIDVVVQNGGTLKFDANEDLDINRGGTVRVETGGTIDVGTFTGSQIDYDNAYSYALVVDGSLGIGDIDINAAATVTFSGAGSVTIHDDLLMTSSPAVINNLTGATLIIGGNISFEAGSDNSRFTNNEYVEVAGDIFFADDNGTVINSGYISYDDIFANANCDNNTIDNTGAVLFQSVETNNSNIVFNNAGTVTQTGNFINNEIDGGSQYVNLATGVWNWSLTPNTAYDGSIGAVFDCSAVGNVFNYTGEGAQRIIDIPYHHLTFSGSDTKSSSDNLDINGDLLIEGSAQLNVDSNSDNITLAGNWMVTSSHSDPFVQGATTGAEMVTFDGSNDQVISNPNGETFNRVTVNKPGGRLILNNTATISAANGTDLTLTRGIINSSSSALLILLDNATATSGDTDSYVDGPVKKIGNDAFVFPTGDGPRFARIGISAPATATTEFTAQYFATPYSDLTTDGTFSHVSGAEYWTLDRAVTTNSVSVTLYWENSLSDITSLTDLTVAHFDAIDQNWKNVGRASTSGVAAGPGTVTSGAVTTFSPFTFGSVNGTNPLPVELMSFSARLLNDEVELNWITATELNNDYFTVEHSLDGEQFKEVKKVKGKGTTSEKSYYKTIDPSPVTGFSYYRLKQTDFDGKVSHSDIRVINYMGPQFASLRTYPNPTKGRSITVEIKGLKETTPVRVEVVDVRGRKLITRTYPVETPGYLKKSLVFERPLSPGMYIIKAGSTLQLTKKIVVE